MSHDNSQPSELTPPAVNHGHDLNSITKRLFHPHNRVTGIIISVCVLLYVLQVLTGVNPLSPTPENLMHWGANWVGNSLGQQPWRLFTALFLHIGILHLVFNMLALYFFGQVAERLFGKGYFLALFVLAGVGGNLLNSYLGWQTLLSGGSVPVSAGASGGIMGLGAALLLVAVFRIPIGEMRLNTKALAWLMGINIAFGFMMPGIDNAGHIGGAVTGAVLALGFIIGLKLPKHLATLICWGTVVAVVLGFYGGYASLHGQWLVMVQGLS